MKQLFFLLTEHVSFLFQWCLKSKAKQWYIHKMEQLLIKVQYERAGQLFASVWLGGGGFFSFNQYILWGRQRCKFLLNRNISNSFWRGEILLLWGWLNINCPERLWSLHPWNYLKTIWQWFCAISLTSGSQEEMTSKGSFQPILCFCEMFMAWNFNSLLCSDL